MKNDTKVSNKERLSETLDKLTEENQWCFLKVLETLAFAQNVQKQAVAEAVRKEG